MQMKGGAECVIDQYIHQYGKRLYGLCLTLCANTMEADDLYQDTWLQVVKNISRYDASRDFEPWLTKICVNLYRNALRRLAKSPFSLSAPMKKRISCSAPYPLRRRRITDRSMRRSTVCRKSTDWP